VVTTQQKSAPSNLKAWDTSSFYNEKVIGKAVIYGSSDLNGESTVAISSEKTKNSWQMVGVVGRNELIEVSVLEGDYFIHASAGGWQHKLVKVMGGHKTHVRIRDGEIALSQSPPQNLKTIESGALQSQNAFESSVRAKITISYDLDMPGEKKLITIGATNTSGELIFKLNDQPIKFDRLDGSNYKFFINLPKGDSNFSVEAKGIDKKSVSKRYVIHVKTDKEVEDEIAAKKEAEARKIEEARIKMLQLENEAKARKTEEERIAREGDGSPDDLDCKKYGLKPQSQGYAECRMRLDLSRRESDRIKAINLANIKAIESARQIELQRRNDEDQRQKQLMANRESRCELMKAQEYLTPGMGSFFDSVQRASSVYENCMAGIPQTITTCSRDGSGGMRCVSK